MKLILIPIWCFTYLLSFFNANAEETTVELVQIVKDDFFYKIFKCIGYFNDF